MSVRCTWLLEVEDIAAVVAACRFTAWCWLAPW